MCQTLEGFKLIPLAVHFKQDSMATILSLKSVNKIDGARLVMDTCVDKNININLKDGASYVF